MAIKTKAQLHTAISSLPNPITPVSLTTVLDDMVDSYEDKIQEYTTVQRDALPALEGRKIYNTTSNRMEYYSTDQWLPCSQKETVAIDCSANPNYQEGLIGDQYIVSVAGKIGGASGKQVYVNDIIYCIVANSGGDEATNGVNWAVCYSTGSTDSPTRYIEVTLTDTQVKASNTTPVEIIPAPGAGKFNLPESIIVTMTYNSAAYATHTNLGLYIDDNNSLVIFDLSKTTNWMQATAFDFSHDDYSNKATKVRATTGDPTAGNSPVKVGIYYKIHTL